MAKLTSVTKLHAVQDVRVRFIVNVKEDTEAQDPERKYVATAQPFVSADDAVCAATGAEASRRAQALAFRRVSEAIESGAAIAPYQQVQYGLTDRPHR